VLCILKRDDCSLLVTVAVGGAAVVVVDAVKLSMNITKN
jgi:hypothetical protein